MSSRIPGHRSKLRRPSRLASWRCYLLLLCYPWISGFRRLRAVWSHFIVGRIRRYTGRFEFSPGVARCRIDSRLVRRGLRCWPPVTRVIRYYGRVSALLLFMCFPTMISARPHRVNAAVTRIQRGERITSPRSADSVSQSLRFDEEVFLAECLTEYWRNEKLIVCRQRNATLPARMN